MSRTVHVDATVAATLGQEQVARLTGPEWAKPVECWDCATMIGPEEDASVLVIQVPELNQHLSGPAPSFVTHAHPACRSSQVVALPLAELQAHRRLDNTEQTSRTDEVTVLATVIGTDLDSAYPVVMLSYGADVTADDPQPDRVDLVSAMMIEWGWQPIRALDQPPGPGPDGWRVRFTHTETGPAAPGVIEVIDPAGITVTEADIQPIDYWRPAVIRSGRTALLQGSQILTDETGVQRALEAGLLTGGTLPVDLVGPGNANVPGSVYR